MRRALLRLMRLESIKAQAFASGAEFLDSLKVCKPDCAVLDLHMPGMTGFDVQARLAQDAPDVQVIFVTGKDSPDSYARAMAAASVAYLRKPMTEQALLDAIDLALQRRETARIHRQTKVMKNNSTARARNGSK